ncbi:MULTISPECIES: DNA mismatch repair protein MutS [Brevundimonas]|jgi:DNA mismatch repair protein MutS|uniref:DNA mismatch repair protein MutS n=1 Tax=Brevundimonas mediterranea TaxID=74329 RepID=A0AB37E658_9CAUL|nr:MULTISPECIES: DNA mismatch repair protein MutS [Brevundimonas]EDX79941.1 DNA mismatch repair protein MutS [Brevundimonas sp. BAL3]MBA4330805.1 DNA mismatch repair protein MutS [Brevundimonas sp.]QIH72853.1 DNA mismatch repair protein MutS [Brevundimonas mediterranea]
MNAPAFPSPEHSPEVAASLEGATPFMAQYLTAKAGQPDAILFFRMGDFYELFFKDAEVAAAALGITLTKRGKHQGEDIPMAGVPVHAMEGYLARLIRLGHKVAICEQLEDPAEAKKRGGKAVVHRGVVRVVTPGTLTEDSLLDARGANRLAAVAVRKGRAAVAVVELSSGAVDSVACALEDLGAALAAFRPSEVLVTDRMYSDPTTRDALDGSGGVVQALASAIAEPQAAQARVERLYGVAALDGFGAFEEAEISALGLIAAYLETTQAGKVPALAPPRRLGESGFLAIDPATRTSLEIDRTQRGEREGSLLACIDRTVTSGGARALAERIARPLRDPLAINEQLDAVEWLLERRDLRRNLREGLKASSDIARAVGRLALGRGGPRDLAAVRVGLTIAEEVAGLFIGQVDPITGQPRRIALALDRLSLSPEVSRLKADLIDGLVDEPSHLARDGGFVRPDYRPELDAARTLRDDSRRVVADLEARAVAESGVAFKVKHNAVLGYFLETSAKAAEGLLRAGPDSPFIHRQTLASQVRFTTVELSELDAKISQAGHRALAIEAETFETWRREVARLAQPLQAVAEALAELDAHAALAEWAQEVGATRPVVDDTLVFSVEAGRHPVVEAAVKAAGDPYTPNNARLDGSGSDCARLAIVTGPNMAGKSTFLRQNALLVILAQAGAFVPARSMRLGVVDRLFSRVGAGDDLARGRSTFMMEMVETAAILTQATPRSFVVLDEIGRGTATYDGLAIAWATAEALHETNRARTLFATHYHELAQLETRLDHVCNLSMVAKEWNGDLVFLHEAAPGAADRSYGVQVAKLAGVPGAVVARARSVLERLEGEKAATARLDDLPLFALAEPAPVLAPSPVETALGAVDPDALTPREALEALYRLKGMLTSR